MATVNLLPNADVSNDWTIYSGSDAFEMVNDDTTVKCVSDLSRLYTTSAGDEFNVEFTNFTESYSSIDSIQVVLRTAANSRGATYVMKASLINEASPSQLYYSENSSTQTASVTYKTINYTSRTTSDGSSAWTNSQLNNIRLVVEVDSLSAGTCHCTYAAIIVTYTEPAVTDNAIFFGTNF